MAFVERVVETVDWKEKGAKVKGRLEAIQPVRYKNGDVGLDYTVRTGANATTKFRGATDINQKIFRSDVGLLLEITYLGEDEKKEVREGNNRPKLFKVLIDSESRVKENVPEITDEDIPF